MLARTYNTTLADSDTSWSATPPNVWLSGLGVGHQRPGRELQIGDVITITGKAGQPEAIKVTALEHVSGDRVGLPGVRFQLVTGQARAAEAGAAHQVRFLFSPASVDAQPLQTPPDRVL